MKKMINKLTYMFILIMALFILPLNSFVSEAAMKRMPVAEQTEQISSSSSSPTEYFKVKTPSDEKYIIYVSGKVKKNVKRLCIRI